MVNYLNKDIKVLIARIEDSLKKGDLADHIVGVDDENGDPVLVTKKGKIHQIRDSFGLAKKDSFDFIDKDGKVNDLILRKQGAHKEWLFSELKDFVQSIELMLADGKIDAKELEQVAELEKKHDIEISTALKAFDNTKFEDFQEGDQVRKGSFISVLVHHHGSTTQKKTDWCFDTKITKELVIEAPWDEAELGKSKLELKFHDGLITINAKERVNIKGITKGDGLYIYEYIQGHGMALRAGPFIGDLKTIINLSDSNDKVDFAKADTETVIYGKGGDDCIYGAMSKKNRIDAGAGNDVIRTGLQGDMIIAGTGDDRIVAASSNHQYQGDILAVDFILAGDGDDEISPGVNPFFINAGAGDDIVNADFSGNWIQTQTGPKYRGYILGGAGNDKFNFVQGAHSKENLGASLRNRITIFPNFLHTKSPLIKEQNIVNLTKVSDIRLLQLENFQFAQDRLQVNSRDLVQDKSKGVFNSGKWDRRWSSLSTTKRLMYGVYFKEHDIAQVEKWAKKSINIFGRKKCSAEKFYDQQVLKLLESMYKKDSKGNKFFPIQSLPRERVSRALLAPSTKRRKLLIKSELRDFLKDDSKKKKLEKRGFRQPEYQAQISESLVDYRKMVQERVTSAESIKDLDQSLAALQKTLNQYNLKLGFNDQDRKFIASKASAVIDKKLTSVLKNKQALEELLILYSKIIRRGSGGFRDLFGKTKYKEVSDKVYNQVVEIVSKKAKKADLKDLEATIDVFESLAHRHKTLPMQMLKHKLRRVYEKLNKSPAK